MRTDFSQAAASRSAAVDAVRRNGKRVEADSVGHTPPSMLNGRARELHNRAAVTA